MTPFKIKTISEFHQLNQLSPPEHPLISVIDYARVAAAKKNYPVQSIASDYYSISIKRGLNGKMHYGQQEYDFDEGVMYFLAPNQVLSVEVDKNQQQFLRAGYYLFTLTFYGIQLWQKT